MTMTEVERATMLAELGLAPDGTTLAPATPTITPEAATPAAEPEQAPAPVPTPVQTWYGDAATPPCNLWAQTGIVPDLTSLTDEQLLVQDAFDTYKLEKRFHGKATSQPHNKLLQRLLNEARNRQRMQRQEAKREAKKDDNGYVREKARARATEEAATVAVEAVLALLKEKGVIE